MTGVKKSLTTHVAMIFTILLVVIFIFMVIVNGTFLRRYFQDRKEKDIVECYVRMNRLFSGEGIDVSSDEFDAEFSRIATGKDMSVIVVDSSFHVTKASGDDDERVLRRMMSYVLKDDPNYLFNMSEDGEKPFERPDDVIIETGSNYEIRMSTDPRIDDQFLELVGTLEGGYIIMIRSAALGIRNNVSVSTRFLIYMALITVIFGAVLINIVTKRITKPILELADLSDKMTNLDFEAKYKGNDPSEIGLLGDRMNRMSETIEHTIAELKTANNELKNDLEKREHLDEMRSDFISNVSHELKTPLALIQGYAEGLKDEVNEDPESRDYYCDVIIDEAGRMNRMVKNLLTLNQLEFGKDVVDMECFDLAELVKNYVASAKILIEQSGVEVSIEGEERLFVWGDEYRIEEVVINYFTNAIHYAAGEKKVVITLEKKGENARFSIFNTGDPIPEDVMEQIWDKFYKADKARSREYGGSGVGLSIVKAIMELHHMPYGACNAEGGVCFWFELEYKNSFV